MGHYLAVYSICLLKCNSNKYKGQNTFDETHTRSEIYLKSVTNAGFNF